MPCGTIVVLLNSLSPMPSESTTRPTLKNAPIEEALLDLRIIPEKTPDQGVLDRFKTAIVGTYPQTFEIRSIRAGFQLSPTELPKAIESTDIPRGLKFSTTDGRYVIEATVDGFTFHRLRPYQEWEIFLPEFRKWWIVYRDLVGPARITRIGLRYINRILLPVPLKDFTEYIVTGPEIGKNLPQAVMELFMRLVIPNTRLENLAIITQVMQPMEGTKVPLIFDIDAIKILNTASTDESLWKIVDDLRTYKNDLFFESMTEKAIGLFQ